MRASKRRPGCLRCRQRHVKCDKAQPICSRCQKAQFSTPCTYDWIKPLHIRQSRYSSLVANSQTETRGCQASSYRGDQVGASRNGLEYLPRLYDQHTQPEAVESEPLTAHRSTPASQSHSQSTTDDRTPYDGSQLPSADGRYIHASTTPSTFPDRIPATDTGNQVSSIAGETSSRQWNVSCETPQARTRILCEEVECKVFDFYLMSAGHWVSASTRISSPEQHSSQ